MATIQPRVQVCLDAETKAIYDRAAKSMGLSTSRLIANICGDAADSIVKVTNFLEGSRTDPSPDALLRSVKGFVVDARQVLSGHQLDVEDAIAASKSKPKAKGKPKA